MQNDTSAVQVLTVKLAALHPGTVLDPALPGGVNLVTLELVMIPASALVAKLVRDDIVSSVILAKLHPLGTVRELVRGPPGLLSLVVKHVSLLLAVWTGSQLLPLRPDRPHLLISGLGGSEGVAAPTGAEARPARTGPA